MSITLKEAQDKISASDGKVAAAFKLAKDKKPQGSLNVDDVRRALKTIEGSRHPNKAKDFFDKIDELRAKKDKREIEALKNKTESGAIRRRGGGIAKRGMGIAK